MSQGILYVSNRIRSWVPKAICAEFNLDYEQIDPEALTDMDDIYFHNFPMKRVPSLLEYQNEDHPHAVLRLHEVLAVMYYFLEPLSDKYAKTKDAQYKLAYELIRGQSGSYSCRADILRYVSLANSDLLLTLAKAFLPLRGETPYNKKVFDTATKQVEEMVANIYEKRLTEYTYLTCEVPTLADFYTCTIFNKGYEFLWGDEFIKKYPACYRWFNTVKAHPFINSFYKDWKFIEKPVAPPQPKKAKKEATKTAPQTTKTASQTTKAPSVEEPAEPKKAKHPLEALGKATFQLDEWKRQYSNNDTRPVALPWFWENYNPEEYSIWKVSYKYNDELTLTFMSNNLIGGFINRLSGSVKYMFGCMVVYGENNNNGITGAMLVRGQDFKPAFEVAPDWESYAFEKLDVSTEEGKEFVNNMWAWDKPVVVDGESKEIADGKVLK